MENYNYFAPQGWQCPICKRVYSPSTPCCFYCGAESKVTTSTSATLNIGGYPCNYPLEEEDDTLKVKGEEE